MKKLLCIIILLSLSMLQGGVYAQSKTKTIDGVAIDSKGIPLPDGDKNITFALYDSPDGETALWMEEQSVAIKDGRFSATLGNVTPFDVPLDRTHWLGIRVGQGNELSPRLQLNPGADIDAASLDPGGWTDDGAVVRLNDPTDNVGIGTASPTRKLHLQNSGPVNLLLKSTNQGGFMAFDRATINNNAGFEFMTNGARRWFLGLPTTTDNLNIVDGFPGFGTVRFMIARSTGNVGIGTTSATSPAARLVVRGDTGTNLLELHNDGSGTPGLVFSVRRETGDVHTEGDFFAMGADVAEYVSTTESVEPGDVIEIDPNNPGQFRKARSAISMKVAGIITTDPGVVLGGNSVAPGGHAGHPAVALAGRVPLKVMAKYGAIEIGDLLVSSPFPGYAMKCQNRNECIGAIIGKAMEPLESGVGKIMVQVMLR